MIVLDVDPVVVDVANQPQGSCLDIEVTGGNQVVAFSTVDGQKLTLKFGTTETLL